MTLPNFSGACLWVIAVVAAALPPAAADELPATIEAIRSIGPLGKNSPAAGQAWADLAKSDADQLTTILRGMQGANPLARNYLRAAFEAIAERELAAGNGLPVDQLSEFLGDHQHDPAARRVAFEWLVRVEPDEKRALLSAMLNDPSLEIRYDAVAQALEQAAGLKEADQAKAIEAYRRILAAARNEEQIKEATKALRDFGEEVDLPLVFGFITDWKTIGPFDNARGIGFAAVYPPEVEVDLEAKYPGKETTVAWTDHTTDDEYGMVDMNKALGKFMGAAGYAYHEFHIAEARDAELRLGCINANKVWLNGELLIANEVYHAGSRVDQYVGRGRLKQGTNAILVKVCQNEQTEDWAQVWQFQLRVCDQFGTAILSQSRTTKLSAKQPTNTFAVTKEANR